MEKLTIKEEARLLRVVANKARVNPKSIFVSKRSTTLRVRQAREFILSYLVEARGYSVADAASVLNYVCPGAVLQYLPGDYKLKEYSERVAEWLKEIPETNAADEGKSTDDTKPTDVWQKSQPDAREVIIRHINDRRAEALADVKKAVEDHYQCVRDEMASVLADPALTEDQRAVLKTVIDSLVYGEDVRFPMVPKESLRLLHSAILADMFADEASRVFYSVDAYNDVLSAKIGNTSNLNVGHIRCPGPQMDRLLVSKDRQEKVNRRLDEALDLLSAK